MIKNITSEICSNQCASCFKEECPRGEWYESNIILPQSGSADKCPLLQFDAKRLERGERYNLTEAHTWALCEKCSHAQKKDGKVDIEKSLEKYCIDCPVYQIRGDNEEKL